MTSTKNAGLEGGLYGKGQVAVDREQRFSALEGVWPELHDELLATGARTKEIRERVAGFLSMQRLRTREQRAQEDFLDRVAAVIDGPSANASAMRKFLTEHWGNSDPSSNEVQAACDFYNATTNMFGDGASYEKVMSFDDQAHRDAVEAALLDRHWFVRHAAKPVLITSDVPVVLWSPRSERDHYRGLGLQTASEIWFPLDPQNLLVMSKDAGRRGTFEVPTRKLDLVSREIASRSFEEVYASPGQKEQLAGLRLAASKPAMRFNTGPMFETRPDGEEIYKGEILQTWIQSYDDV